MGEVERPSGSPAGLRLRRPLSLATAGYTIGLLIATHYPRPQEVLLRLGAGGVTDKTLHVVAYAVLGLLAAATLASWGRWTARNGALLLGALAAFGAADELTQPLFGRFADAGDWVGDCAGIVAGVLAVAVCLAVVARRPQASA